MARLAMLLEGYIFGFVPAFSPTGWPHGTDAEGGLLAKRLLLGVYDPRGETPLWLLVIIFRQRGLTVDCCASIQSHEESAGRCYNSHHKNQRREKGEGGKRITSQTMAPTLKSSYDLENVKNERSIMWYVHLDISARLISIGAP